MVARREGDIRKERVSEAGEIGSATNSDPWSSYSPKF